MFPDRYIIKPNLVKSRIFRSAKNTNCQTEATNEEDLYDEFNINDAIDGKTTKRKSKGKSRENTTFDNVTFNPFGANAPRRKTKEKLNLKGENQSNLGKSSINNNENDMENYENYENAEDFEEEEYKRKMEFYKKMLKNEGEENSQLMENEQNNISRIFFYQKI